MGEPRKVICQVHSVVTYDGPHLNTGVNQWTPTLRANQGNPASRPSIDGDGTGATAVANLVHPNPTQGAGGSGNSTWEFPNGSSYMNLSTFNNGVSYSPGQSGYSPQGAGTTDLTHDWYLGISASPNSIGSKTFYGLLYSVEFL